MVECQESAIADLLNFKLKLENNVKHLIEERAAVKQKIQQVRDHKVGLRAKQAAEMQKQYKLNIESDYYEDLLDNQINHINNADRRLQELETASQEQMKIANFEQSILQLKSSIEGAINFYTEDSLQIEFMKRQKEVRDKRVEFTKLEDEYTTLLERIEEERLEKERLKQAEEERARQEAERIRRIEEEMRRQEAERIKNQFRISKVNESSSFREARLFDSKRHENNGVSEIPATKMALLNDCQSTPSSDKKNAIEGEQKCAQTKSISNDFFSKLLSW